MVKKRVKARKISKLPNSANVLAIIASVLFLLNGIIAIFFKNVVINILQEMPEFAAITEAVLITMGISYLAMSLLIFCINRMVIKTSDKGWMWGLLVAGILAFFAGRIDASILTIIASIIYLTHKKK